MKLKHVFKTLFSGILIKIKDGPLKGKKWIATSGCSYFTGEVEPYKTEAFIKYFRKGSILYDIGGHIGYFSAIAASINGDSGQ